MDFFFFNGWTTDASLKLFPTAHFSGSPYTSMELDSELQTTTIFNIDRRFTKHLGISFFLYIKVSAPGNIIKFYDKVHGEGFYIHVAGKRHGATTLSVGYKAWDGGDQAFKDKKLISTYNKMKLFVWHHVGVTVDFQHHSIS